MSHRRIDLAGGESALAKNVDLIPAPTGGGGNSRKNTSNPLHHDTSECSVSSSLSKSSTSVFEVDNAAKLRSTICSGVEIPLFSTPRTLALIFLNSLTFVFMSTTFYMASAFYYVPILKMSLTWATAASAVANLVAIYAGVFIGYYGDRVVSRFGKRKPLAALFWPIMAISAMAIYYCPFGDRVGIQGWYLLCIVVFAFGATCYGSVMGSWYIESCSSTNDYMRISITGGVSSALGALGGVVVSSILGIHGVPTVLATIISMASFVTILIFVPSRVINKASVQPPLLSSFRVLSRTSEYRSILSNKTILTTAFSICGEFLLYISFMAFPGITHYHQILGFYTIYAVIGIIGAVPVILLMGFLIGRKWEKITLYMNITLALVAISVALFVLYIPGLIPSSAQSDGSYIVLFDLWMALIIVALLLFQGAMFCEGLIYRDLIRFDTFRTGLNRENLYQTALNVPAQIVSAIVTAIPMAIFTSSGFRPLPNPPLNDDLMSNKYAWNYASHVQICVYSTVLFGVGSLYSYYIFYRYPLVQSVADKIEVVLNKRTVAQTKREKADARSRGSVFGSTPANLSTTSEKGETDLNLGNDPEDGKNPRDDDDVSQLSWGLSSIADDQDEMLMNHFSAAEVRAMSVSENDERNCNMALHRVQFYHRINLYLASPATIAALLAALWVQIVNNSQYQVLVVNLLCIATFFCLYECLRVIPMTQACASSGIDVLLKAKSAYRSMTAHQESLKEMLLRNGIDAEDQEGKRESLAGPVVSEGTGEFSEGETSGSIAREYARLLAVQAVLGVLGVLFATVIH